MSYHSDVARLFVAPAATAFLGDAKGVIFRGLGDQGADVVIKDAVVSRLRSQREEQSTKVVTRERVTLHVDPAKLPANRLPLVDEQKVTVAAYPGADFNVVVDETDYGGALVKVTVARKPVDRLRDKRRRS